MFSLCRIFVISFILYTISTNDSFRKIKISSERQFIDEMGRSISFAGVNIVYKQPPYYPDRKNFSFDKSLTDKDIEVLKSLGINLVRLGVIWEAVETSPGIYDDKYLEKINDIIKILGENGIYTILDSHQDLFSKSTCGEGVPVFYSKQIKLKNHCQETLMNKLFYMFDFCKPMEEFNMRKDSDGSFIREDCAKHHFFKFHISPEFGSSYEAFYKNEFNLQDKFASYWKFMADFFKKKQNTFIIGYDLWNEPWPGDVMSDYNLLYPSWPEKIRILPFYKKIDSEIRTIDPDYMLFYSPAPFPTTISILGGLHFQSYYETPHERLNLQVFNSHLYCCQVAMEICMEELPDGSLKTQPDEKDHFKYCKEFHKNKLSLEQKEADYLGVPHIVTEFGACDDKYSCYLEIKSSIEAFNKYLTSWAIWNFKPYEDITTSSNDLEGFYDLNGNLQEVKVMALGLPKAQRLQGKPIRVFFDYDTALFNCIFEYNSNINGPSVIYFNESIYSIEKSKSFKNMRIKNDKYEFLLIYTTRDFTKSCILSNEVIQKAGENFYHIDGLNGSYGDMVSLVISQSHSIEYVNFENSNISVRLKKHETRDLASGNVPCTSHWNDYVKLIIVQESILDAYKTLLI